MATPPAEMSELAYRPIGIIRSQHKDPAKTPIQPVYARSLKGRAVILPEYAEGLADLEGFSHIHLIYHFHKAGPTKLTVKPFLQDVPHGVFSTRAPCRPNAIGVSLVRLVRRDGNVLHLEDVDVLDGTPLLDIKPFVARFDQREDVRCGWQDEVDESAAHTRGLRGFEDKQ